jgi:hypothetical protein
MRVVLASYWVELLGMPRNPDMRPGNWAYRAVALCCVLLIAMTGFVAAVHVHTHANDSGVPNHSCSVCALAHSGVAPAQVASVVPVFARSALFQAYAQAPLSLLLVPSQFIRPPPLG